MASRAGALGRAAAARPRPALLLALAAAVGVLLLRQRAGAGDAADSQPAFLGAKMANASESAAECFPGAMTGPAVMSKVTKALRPYGIKRGNTIYGQSISSDEINGDRGHFPVLMATRFGHAFNLGGIGGAPYAGKTGFRAFASHVPDDGHVVLVFGPHIGFTTDGEPGRFLRRGQTAESTACGALIAAQDQVTSGKTAADPQDAQQSWLRAQLKRSSAKVAGSDQPMVDLVMEAYRIIEKEVLAIVNTKFGSGNLVLIGGIQINMPYPMRGQFVPLHFSVRSAGQAPVDLMSTFE